MRIALEIQNTFNLAMFYGEGFCCEPKAQAKNARSLPTENVDYEKLQYYYHSDHLGSASYITNLDGEVVQHIEYVPFGEVFLEERNNTWNTPFLFNGKELDEETGLYYYGARYYNPKTSQFLSTDRYAEKYPDASPYQYCLNNPVNALEINGDSILITGNNTQELYTAGMTYQGNDKFITQTVDYLNKINSTNGGAKLINKLSSSKNNFNFINQTPINKKGNPEPGVFPFKENSNDGGGTILAGEFANSKVSEFAKIEGVAHEMFHGYQHNERQGGASIFNEFEAHVFGYSVAEGWAFDNDYIGALSGTPFGTNTPTGKAYENAFSNMKTAYSSSDFVTGVKSFIKGYQKGQLYGNRGVPLRRSNQKKALIKSFYPIQ